MSFIYRCSIWAPLVTLQMSQQQSNSSHTCYSISQSTLFIDSYDALPQIREGSTLQRDIQLIFDKFPENEIYKCQIWEMQGPWNRSCTFNPFIRNTCQDRHGTLYAGVTVRHLVEKSSYHHCFPVVVASGNSPACPDTGVPTQGSNSWTDTHRGWNSATKFSHCLGTVTQCLLAATELCMASSTVTYLKLF